MLRLLGEIEDPAEAYIRSVGDLAETLAVDRFNKFLRANRGRIETLEDGSKVRVGGNDIIDGEAYMALPRAARDNYTELMDPGFGSLMSRAADAPTPRADGSVPNVQLKDRIFARNPVFNDLTRANKQRHDWIDIGVRGFLLGKGFAQKVKTVYAPSRRSETSRLLPVCCGARQRGTRRKCVGVCEPRPRQHHEDGTRRAGSVLP